MNQAFRITAHLAGGLITHPNEGVTIDGPLLYAVMLEQKGDSFFGSQPTPAAIAAESERPHPRMPLAVHEQAGHWTYKASHGLLVGRVGTDMHHVHKRFDMPLAQAHIGDIADRRTRLPTNTGEFKAYRLPRWVELVERVEWNAVGDLQETLRLLQEHVTHIGKQTGTGHGVVAAWEVVEHNQPGLWMFGEDGNPARPLPVEWVGAARGARASIRPPYWLPQHQTECVTP